MIRFGQKENEPFPTKLARLQALPVTFEPFIPGDCRPGIRLGAFIGDRFVR